MTRWKACLLAGATTFGLWATNPAAADILITCQTGAQAGSGNLLGCVQGSAGNPGEVILFNTATTVLGGSTILGVTNQSDIPILFSTTGDTFTVNQTGGGQANLTATDGFLDDLTVQVGTPPGGNFTAFVYNLDAAGSGTATFTINALDSLGGAEVFTSVPLAITASGQNFFLFEASNGEVITSIGFTSSPGTNIQGVVFDQNISSITQPRIAVVPGTTIPEPASLALFGIGLLGLGLVNRRQKKSSTPPLAT
jgi:hypothetical protein